MQEDFNDDNEQPESWHLLTPADLPAEDGTLPRTASLVWGAVLASRNIPYRLEQDHQRFYLLVPDSRRPDALWELQLYEKYNRARPLPRSETGPLADTILSTLSVLILLAGFHNLVHADRLLLHGTLPDWLQLGMAQSDKIRAGEWWRVITALTLHADLPHLLGNLGIGGMFVFLLCCEVGAGLSWSLVLGAGAIGNVLNAWLHADGYRSVGASTAVFGAVGALAAISAVRYHRQLQQRWPLPVAAALALLVLLGSEGAHTDLGAHLFGFLAGLVLGVLTELLLSRYGNPGPYLKRLLVFCNILVVTAAWWFALHSVSLLP